jgi:broad specificity phosphatase PhoE
MPVVRPGGGARMRRRIYLMRHAEAAYFPDPPVRVDPAEVVLTDLGLEQARAAGQALRDVRFDRVVTSGLPRTTRTAELVVEQLAHPPADTVLHHDADLQELRPGDLDAVRDEDLEESFLTAWRGVPPRDAVFLGGESVGSLVDRVGRAMERIHAEDSWNTLLLVAHGGTNRAILSAALAGPGTFFGHLEQSAACVNILDAGTDFVVRAVNVTPYDLVHGGPRTTTLEQMLERYRDYRRGRHLP